MVMVAVRMFAFVPLFHVLSVLRLAITLALIVLLWRRVSLGRWVVSSGRRLHVTAAVPGRRSVLSIAAVTRRTPRHTSLVAILLSIATLRLRILPPSPAAVSVRSKVMRLPLGQPLGFVTIDPVHALCLDEFVDFCGSNACEKFLFIERHEQFFIYVRAERRRTFINGWDGCWPVARR